MRSFLREPWIAAGLLTAAGAAVSAFFYARAGGIIGPNHWWMIETEGGSIRLSAGSGFNWIFGTFAMADPVGTSNLTREELFPAPQLAWDLPPEFLLEIVVPLWMVIAAMLVGGGIRMRMRRRRTVGEVLAQRSGGPGTEE